MPMDHEVAFVAAFVVPEKRARYRDFLKKLKKRHEILDRFCHKFDIVAKYATQIPRTDTRSLIKMLQGAGAGEMAWVIGGNSELDGRELPLETAINDGLA